MISQDTVYIYIYKTVFSNPKTCEIAPKLHPKLLGDVEPRATAAAQALRKLLILCFMKKHQVEKP